MRGKYFSDQDMKTYWNFWFHVLNSTYTFIRQSKSEFLCRNKFSCKILVLLLLYSNIFHVIHYILKSAKYILLSRKINKNKLDTFPSFNSARNTEQTDFTSSIKKINAELHLRTSDTNFSIFHFRRFPSSNTMNYSHACPRKENFSLFSPSHANIHISLSFFRYFKRKVPR